MVLKLLRLAWKLITLPARLALLPYKIISTIVSLIIYAMILAIIGGVIYFFVI